MSVGFIIIEPSTSKQLARRPNGAYLFERDSLNLGKFSFSESRRIRILRFSWVALDTMPVDLKTSHSTNLRTLAVVILSNGRL